MFLQAIEDAQWEERQRVKALEKALEGVEGIGNPPSPESETAQGAFCAFEFFPFAQKHRGNCVSVEA